MARNHGRFESATWRDDDDWRSLPADAQWLYMALVSQSDLTLAGVLHISRRRWTNFAADMTARRLDKAIGSLSDRRFIVVDEDTEEVLVRSFARRETQWANVKRRGGLKSAVQMIQSPPILEALMAELSRVGRNLDGNPIEQPIEPRSTEDRSTERPKIGQSATNPDPIPVNADSNVSRLPSVVDVPVGSSVTSSSRGKPRREDPLWDSIVAACGLNPAEITEPQRGATNKALAQLRQVNATPQGITARAVVYRRRFPNAALTPTALAKQWAACSPAQEPTSSVWRES